MSEKRGDAASSDDQIEEALRAALRDRDHVLREASALGPDAGEERVLERFRALATDPAPALPRAFAPRRFLLAITAAAAAILVVAGAWWAADPGHSSATREPDVGMRTLGDPDGIRIEDDLTLRWPGADRGVFDLSVTDPSGGEPPLVESGLEQPEYRLPERWLRVERIAVTIGTRTEAGVRSARAAVLERTR